MKSSDLTLESGSKMDIQTVRWTIDIELFETKMEELEFVIPQRWEGSRGPQHTRFLALYRQYIPSKSQMSKIFRTQETLSFVLQIPALNLKETSTKNLDERKKAFKKSI